MKKLKYQIIFTILFMTIGIAAVTTNLVTNGNTNIASNPDDFLVYFSDAKINGVQDLSLVDSETSLVFNKELSAVGQNIVITYDVTNASKNYDADIDITCTQSTEYLTITNSFDTANNLGARATKTGTLSITLSKSYTGPDLSQEISCTINASAVERTTQGSATVPDAVEGYYPMLMATHDDDTSMFRADEYRERITSIIFEDEIDVPTDAIDVWDISTTQDGSIIAYVINNDDYYIDKNSMESCYDAYDLVIQSNGSVYANPDMSDWFASFIYLKSLINLDNLNTISATDMSYMFYGTGCWSDALNLNLGENFDTRNVIDMNTMFFETGYYSDNFTLNLGGKFDTSNVVNMGGMFDGTGYKSEDFTLDLGEKFDTSKVTDMNGMFAETGYNSTKLNFSITIRNPNTTSYINMFKSVATKDGSQIIVNYTSETEALVDEIIATKSPDSNVIKGVQVD